ncbi:MAG: glycosyltransferase family 39 protein, partial [Candidatus Hinthialibacter sp.]
METEIAKESNVSKEMNLTAASAAPEPLITRKDWLVAILVVFILFAGLLLELKAPGVTWDEGQVQFSAAKKQAEWIRNLAALDAPFSKETIDQYWYTKSDHPSPPRTLAAFSYLLFNGWIDEITALRLPSAVIFSLLAGSIYLFLRLFMPRPASLAGAFSLALTPRVFGHAHLFSLDLPMTAWWFWAAAAGFLVFHGKLKPLW